MPGPYDDIMYGDWRIYYDPPPIPSRNCDWHYVHDDFDGAPDAGDNRYGSCATAAECRDEIDAYEEERCFKAPEADTINEGEG